MHNVVLIAAKFRPTTFGANPFAHLQRIPFMGHGTGSHDVSAVVVGWPPPFDWPSPALTRS